MKLIKKIVLILLALVALVVGILFSKRNAQPVELDILVTQLPAFSMAVWILISFILGFLVSGLYFTVIHQAHKRRYARLSQAFERNAKAKLPPKFTTKPDASSELNSTAKSSAKQKSPNTSQSELT